MSGPEGSSIKNARLCVMVFIRREMMVDDIKYMKIAYQEAVKAKEKDEVPIGAVIVCNDKVIAKAFNQREHKQVVTAHAETIAIEKACKKLNTWRLDDCTLYCTLEPCVMCSGVIMQSRIKRVVYGASTEKWIALTSMIRDCQGFNHIPEVTGQVLEDECASLLKKYFKDKR